MKAESLFIEFQEELNEENFENAFKLIKLARKLNPDEQSYYKAYLDLGTTLGKNEVKK
jgi:hypothetical protein